MEIISVPTPLIIEMIICQISCLVPTHTMPSICWTKMNEYNLLELSYQLSILSILELFLWSWWIDKTNQSEFFQFDLLTNCKDCISDCKTSASFPLSGKQKCPRPLLGISARWVAQYHLCESFIIGDRLIHLLTTHLHPWMLHILIQQIFIWSVLLIPML